MNQKEAIFLFENLGKLVILDAPSDFQFGIDLMEFQCGPKFKGMKFIPIGIHLINYNTNAALKHGEFINITKKVVL